MEMPLRAYNKLQNIKFSDNHLRRIQLIASKISALSRALELAQEHDSNITLSLLSTLQDQSDNLNSALGCTTLDLPCSVTQTTPEDKRLSRRTPPPIIHGKPMTTHVANFVSAYCSLDPSAYVTASDLYAAFKTWWAKAVGGVPPSHKRFGGVLKNHFPREKRAGRYHYFGLQLLTHA